ncbi:transposase [Streptomyces somaliensis]|uniref:Transposase n=1 Tax=Streptomyces somaliensis (strain ATCC 33201 / DSM 40738 / JCM 12659 / KCTC 9044 / NCTC 11332 / NRRL B-12077 / IP 733) TaxID=1134445 RepID=A0AA44IFD8_STRE0|nr:transposase [Streptomyces somaliensis DSM 40738]
MICDGRATPVKVATAANVNDITPALALTDGIPPVAGRPGRPRRRPEVLLGDKGYNSGPTAANCASAGSSRSSPAEVPRTSRVWASSATSWSRSPPCSTSSNASSSAGTTNRTSRRLRLTRLRSDLLKRLQEDPNMIVLRACSDYCALPDG